MPVRIYRITGEFFSHLLYNCNKKDLLYMHETIFSKYAFDKTKYGITKPMYAITKVKYGIEKAKYEIAKAYFAFSIVNTPFLIREFGIGKAYNGN
jgi:hypothetical protein